MKDPITLATVVIAIATIVNVAVSWWIGYNAPEYTKPTKDIYMAANRPYIGVYDFKEQHIDAKLHIKIIYKNVGTVPATNVV